MKENVDAAPQDGKTPPPFDQQIEMISSRLESIRLMRKRQMLASVLGVVVIIVLFSILIGNLFRISRDFDVKELAVDLTRNANIVTDSPEFNGMIDDMKTVMLPALKTEMAAAFQRELPNFRQKGLDSLEELQKFVKVNVRNQVLAKLEKRLKTIEQKVLAKHNPKDLDSIEKALDKVNARFMDDMASMLEKELGGAVESLAGLDAQIQEFKKTPEFANLKGYHAEEVENKLLETFLELWICQLNPAKAQALAMPERTPSK